MIIPSRILTAPLLLLGIPFLIAQNRGCSARPCQGKIELSIGLDANGCEYVNPAPVTKEEFAKLFKDNNIGKECYKVHSWICHNLTDSAGDLSEVECRTKEGDARRKNGQKQPTGTGGTQRVMFETSTAKDAFEKQLQAVAHTHPQLHLPCASATPSKK